MKKSGRSGSKPASGKTNKYAPEKKYGGAADLANSAGPGTGRFGPNLDGMGPELTEAPNRRLAMAEREVQQTIATYLLRDLRDELPGIVTVSKVRMTTDLRTAKVFVSVLAPGEDEAKLRKEAAQFLQHAAVEIQDNLAKVLQMRYVPKLTFIADDVIEKVLKVETLLHNISKENSKNAAAKKSSDENGDAEGGE